MREEGGGERGDRGGEEGGEVESERREVRGAVLLSAYLLKRMDCVWRRSTILCGSGPSVLLAVLEHRNSYALFTASNTAYKVT